MKLSGRHVPAILLTVGLGAAVPGTLRAQSVLAETETLGFDRPESWGMKYYASLALLTGMGVPQERKAGAIDIGFEGGYVPQLSDIQRRIGFDGTKLEDVNKTSAFGRLRGSVGLGRGVSLELAYTPPIDRGGATPNLFAIALGRPFELTGPWRLGLRGYGQIGKITADVTCSAGEVAAGDDGLANPFRCVRPSSDETRQKVAGLEVVLGRDGRSRFKPYAGLGLGYMDLEFRLDALYADGRILDHTVQTTSGTTMFATAGVTLVASKHLFVTGELFYTRLGVARPPSITAADEGLVNGRVLVSYRFH
jgi:hypothetical protein